MSSWTRATSSRIARAAGALAVAGTLAGAGGAVGAHLVTSRDIKDGTIQTRDVSAAARSSFESLQGYEIVRNQVEVEADSDGSVIGTCPVGKRALGVDGFFDSSDPAQSTVLSDGSGGIVFGHNTGPAEELNVRVTCATAG